MKNNRLLLLIQGEFQRFNKYGVTTISFVVAVVWFLMLYFLDNQLLDQMLPVIILMDTTMMAVLFIGATMFFEKSESTISTLLVTPIRPAEIIGSKVIANAIHTLFATMLVVVVFYFTRGVNVQYFYMVIVLLIVSSFHTLLGLVFSYMSKVTFHLYMPNTRDGFTHHFSSFPTVLLFCVHEEIFGHGCCD